LKSLQATSIARPVPRRGGTWWAPTGLASAAAALLGLVAGWYVHAALSREASAPAPTIASRGGVIHEALVPGSGPAPGAGTGVAVEAPVLHVLPGSLRTGEPPRQRWSLDPGLRSIGVAVPIVIPESVKDEDRYRFELRGPDGKQVWSQE